MKHERAPTPTPPPAEPIGDGPPIPLDADGKPDLQELVRRWGSYGAVPREVWAGFDEAMARWHQRRRDRFMR